MFPKETFDVTIVNMAATLMSSVTEVPVETREKAARSHQPPCSERLQFLAVRSAFLAGSVIAPNKTAEKGIAYFMTPQRISRPGWEVEVLKTARRIELRSGLIAYSWGSGPRVLLVHGWDSRGTQMGRIATAVAAAGFEAICVDLPGHGESPGELAHVPLAKDALLTVGEELGPFHAVVGHSFGAGVALFAVYQGLRADRIVYLAGPSRFVELFDRYCAWVGIWGSARTRFDDKVKALVEMDPAETYPAVWAKKIDEPALIIHDRNDEDCPFAEGEEMHRNWKGSQFFATTGLGHRRVLKSKEVIQRIVDFLKT